MTTGAEPGLPKSTPEAEGVASGAILEFISEAEKNIQYLHSLIVVRHGRIIAEGWWKPYEPDDPHILFSLSKSFTATAVGLAAGEGKLRLDEPVISFFPEMRPAKISHNLAAMQVRHLLTMTTGHAEDTTEALARNRQISWVQSFLALPVKYSPGTHFLYNTGATYMLSALVQKVIGLSLLEYLQPRLFEPLGITHQVWESSPQGVNAGGFGLSLTTAEVTRFGQLYLQGGEWRGQRLLPSGWVEEASARQVSNGNLAAASDWEQGYGYQFWRCRYGAYRGDGAGGQFCVIMPEQETVLAITAGVDDMQGVLNLVWKHLLPALKNEPLPADSAAQQALTAKLTGLELPTVPGQPLTATANRISGQKFRLAENKQQLSTFALAFGKAGNCLVTLEDKQGRQHQLDCGNGKWSKGTTTLDQNRSRPYGACGGWTDEGTYVIQLYYRSPTLPDPPLMASSVTPFSLTLTCHFAKDKVIIEQQATQSFVSNRRPRLEGRLA